jgi:hypothetical protein
MLIRTVVLLIGLQLLAPTSVWCAPAGAVIRGVTTSQQSVLVPGVAITVIDLESDRQVAGTVSGGDGRFTVAGLRPGRYRLVAKLAGFEDLTLEPVVAAERQEIDIKLDLSVGGVSENVTVVGEASSPTASPLETRPVVKGEMADLLPVAGDGLRSLLPVLPGVVRTPDGRISLKGARPTQGTLQLDQVNGSDPSTGNFGIELPTDAVSSIGLVSNPYAAEDGRFSSSMVKLDTRTGSNRWRGTANTFVPIPCLKLCDGESVGFVSYNPRAWVGGPLVRERLFLSQSLEFRLNKIRVPSLQAPNNLTKTYSYDVFTRVDGNLGGRHTLKASLAFFPRDIHYFNLDTFNLNPVTANLRLRGYSVGVSDAITLAPTVVGDLHLGSTRYHTGIYGQGSADMELTPNGNRGNFFNTQDRQTRAFEFGGALTIMRSWGTSEHLVKAGVDVLPSDYTGWSHSHPVLIERADGHLSQRIGFGSVTTVQQVAGTDVSLFAQDQWRLTERLRLEPGIRMDRDGVLRATSVSPRLSVVLGVLPDGKGVLQAGGGVFYERTPLNIGAFESLEPATVTRFASDGVTPITSAITFHHRTTSLEVPRATVWNVEYDHRIGRQLFLKLNHLQRRGSHEFVVNPIETGAAGELQLASSGRSRHSETEVTVRAGAGDERYLAVTYVRSTSAANLNAYDQFFGNIRNPVVRPDQYATASVDVPHRLMARAAIPLLRKWVLSPMVEVRSGFPYSVLNEDQDFVGVRNQRRYPMLYTLDANLLKHVTIKGRSVLIGLRGWHLLDNFSPRDVQANIDSPSFGTFYNTIPRKIICVFQFTAMSGELAR